MGTSMNASDLKKKKESVLARQSHWCATGINVMKAMTTFCFGLRPTLLVETQEHGCGPITCD